jgi:hypothetical protein
VLYVHYTASGGDEKRIVRAGEKDVWVYDLLVGWVTADEAGMPGAGRGIQNPDDVLLVLSNNSGTSKMAAQPGAVEMAFTGGDIASIMKEQANKGAFNWKDSKAELTLAVDAENRLQKFTCDATLAANAANGGGPATVKYTGEVTLVAYNEATSLKFLDEKKREIPLTPEMKTKIDSVLKEKR